MSFHSLDYAVFLIAVLGIYWSLGARWQNRMLIPASWIFYGYVHPWFLIPFFATTLIDYVVAIGLESSRINRRLLVAASVCSNVGLLAVFKYYDFFAANVGEALEALHLHVPLPVLAVVLPAGISFYTFQSVGYVVDVYRGHVRACRSLVDYALFVAFFPLLVAGPIQRAGDFLAQIQRPRTLEPSRFLSALYLLIWGVFKKVVIADNVAITANKIFALKELSFPDLCGLFGLHGYRERFGAALRFRVVAEFQSSLYRAIANGLLAALAHFSFDMDPRLHLYSARGFARHAGQDHREPDHRLFAHGPLAWGLVEFRFMGIVLCRPDDSLPRR